MAVQARQMGTQVHTDLSNYGPKLAVPIAKSCGSNSCEDLTSIAYNLFS